MATIEAPARVTTIGLEAGCDHASCATLAHRLRTQLNTPKYTRGISLMPCPDSRQEWEDDHRTARKRAWRAERLGYTFAPISLADHNDDIHEINTSLQQRQGRPMTAGYLRRTTHGTPPDYPCPRHRISTYGVLHDGRLRAYSTVYRVGDLALVSMIIGHGAHLENGVMYLLFAGIIDEQAGEGGYLYYNRHDSGTDGLRFYKERLGFEAADIEWALG